MPDHGLTEALTRAVVAGLLASLACGLGVLPLLIKRIDPARHTGLGYAFACGLMFSASVYNLIWPGITQMGEKTAQDMNVMAVLPVVIGIMAGGAFLSASDRFLGHYTEDTSHFADGWGGKVGVLIFVAMTVHSIPEGVAVGVGYASEGLTEQPLGTYLAVAIAIHNIPEGLAVAIPMRSSGASIHKCFWAAFLTSLPQPIAAVPAVLAAWFFRPIMPVLMGFAAGAMIFLVLLELIPDALATEKPKPIAWAFVIGFCLMLMIQIVL